MREAEPLYRQALDIYRSQSGDRTPLVANCLNSLAGFYHETGRYDLARDHYEQALDIWREQVAKARELATALNNLAGAIATPVTTWLLNKFITGHSTSAGQHLAKTMYSLP